MEGLEQLMSHEEQLRELEFFSLEKERLRGDSLQHPEGRLWQAGGWPLFPCKSYRMGGNGLNFCQGKFRLDIRKHFLSEKGVRHWNEQLR